MTTWHADDVQLAALRDLRLAPVAATSVEAHLIACAECRTRLARLAPAPASGAADARAAAERRDRVWDAIADRIDRPSTTGAGPWWMRVTVGTPTLALVTFTLALALLAVPLVAAAGSTRAAVAALFAVAPLVPVLGAAVAYRVDTDPAGELAMATPMLSIRLVLARTAMVLAVALPLGVIAAALLPVPFTLVIGWLLPGLALCGLVLAGAPRVDPARLGPALALGWALVVGVAFLRTRTDALDVALEHLFVNQPVTQMVCAVVAAASAVVVATHRTRVRPWSAQ